MADPLAPLAPLTSLAVAPASITVYSRSAIPCSTLVIEQSHAQRCPCVCDADIVVSLTGYSRVRWDKERTYTKGFIPRGSLKHTETLIDRTVSLIKHGELQFKQLLCVFVTLAS